jgi:NTE family protein
MKGFAHIGVIRALEELGIVPTLYAGTSIGALIAAARAGGASLDVMAEHATQLKRRDLFRLNHVGMLLERMRSPSIYQEAPLRELIERNVPPGRLADLPVPALISTVDVERGSQLVWGLPGLDNVSVSDAVYASCALPGFFPPGRVNGRLCIDGGTIDNLPAAITADRADVVIAVDVGSSELSQGESIASHGFAATYMRWPADGAHPAEARPGRMAPVRRYAQSDRGRLPRGQRGAEALRGGRRRDWRCVPTPARAGRGRPREVHRMWHLRRHGA